MSDIYQAANFLTEDLDALERAAKAAGSSSIPANLRRSLLTTLGKLMKILGTDEYPTPEGYQKPSEKGIFDRLIEDVKELDKQGSTTAGFIIPEAMRKDVIRAVQRLLLYLSGENIQRPGQPASTGLEKPEYPKTVNDKERKKAMKIRVVPKTTQEAEKAAPAPTHFDQTPVSADAYAILARSFGDDFAARYYVASAAKSGTSNQKRRGIFQYVEPSPETLAAQARADARAAEIEQRMAAEEAERRRQTAAIASLFDSTQQPR